MPNIMGFGGTGSVQSGNDTATVNDIAAGKTAHINGVQVTGAVPTAASLTKTSNQIEDMIGESKVKASAIVTDGTLLSAGAEIDINMPYANLASAIGITAAKIAKNNTILGIEGIADSLTPSIEDYTGDYTVTPKINTNIILATQNKRMTSNLTVNSIPISIVSNDSGGETLIIGE